MLDDQGSQNDGELKPITFENLEKMKTSSGDLYWKKGDGKLIKLLHSGDIVEFSKLKRFQKVTDHLFINEYTESEFIERGLEILNQLKVEESELARLNLREELKELILPIFWRGESSASLLNLVILFNSAFYDIAPSFAEDMDEKAFSLHRRASLYASLMALTSYMCGYTHFSLLKDIYNISFFNDFSFSKREYKSEEHIEIDHSENSFEDFQESGYYNLTNKQLSKLIKFHHESFSGEGRSYQLNINELSELEKISIFLESTLSRGEYEYTRGDGDKFLWNLLTAQENENEVMASFRDYLFQKFNDNSTKEEAA
ncbi:hypothetical protein [Halobacteriovorax marinus]|uniref:hypothetical protein n=1 Tax=Halobacteriovorax marinus TaxID=97084 RepID=UPI003A93A08A